MPMSVNYDKYIQLLSEAFKREYAQITRKQTESYVVKASKITKAGDYTWGIAVPYVDRKEKLVGQYFLGLTDLKKTVRLASILGMDGEETAASDLDDKVASILTKFMCTVVGEAVEEWDGLGLTTTFNLPLKLNSKKIIKLAPTRCETHIVTLRIAGDSIAMFVTFEEFAETVLTGKKVLVVDDSRTIRKVLVKALKNQGCTTAEAVDGADAVSKFKAERPALTITDMVMPKMDGLEAISRIRKIAPEAKVLVLTSTADKKEVVAAASLGIRGYVKKPVKPEKIIEAAIGCFD